VEVAALEIECGHGRKTARMALEQGQLKVMGLGERFSARLKRRFSVPA